MAEQEQANEVTGFDLGLDLDLGTSFETDFGISTICEI